jgi:hypothetical protein
MLNWSDRIVYESVAIDGGDVVVFAKGINTRKKVNRGAQDIRCLYYHGDAGNIVTSLPATTSAQQVFRCPPPPATAPVELRVTLVVAGEEPIPSLATYDPPRHHASSVEVTGATAPGKKKLICACTMVRDMAKFLREWVVYHAAVGVDRFYVYDRCAGSPRPGLTSPPRPGLGPRLKRLHCPTVPWFIKIRASGWCSSMSTSSSSPHIGVALRNRPNPCSGQ